MGNKDFSIREAIRYGWDTTWKYFGLLVGITIISVVISWVPGLFRTDIVGLDLLISLVVAVVNALVAVGILKVYLRLHDGEKPEILDIFRYPQYLVKYLLASLLIGLIVFLGLILFIVPGIIWGIKYQFAINLIVDRDAGVMEALRESAALTSGVKWRLFLFNLAVLGVIILGALALGIGLLVAIPIISLADVCIYRKLLKNTAAPKIEEKADAISA